MEAILKEYFGYDKFRYGQQEIIENILDGRNALGILPTGSGNIMLSNSGLMFEGNGYFTADLMPTRSTHSPRIRAECNARR